MRCKDCPEGRFESRKGAIACTSCPAGRYGQLAGQISEDESCYGLCLAGRYGNPGQTQSTCTAPCPAGRYSIAGTGVECTKCPAGTYGSNQGLEASECSGPCTGAPAGSRNCDTSGSGSTPSPSLPDNTPPPSTSRSVASSPPVAIIAATTAFLIALLVFVYVVYAYGFKKPRPASRAVVRVQENSRAGMRTSTEDEDDTGNEDVQAEIMHPSLPVPAKAKGNETLAAAQVAPARMQQSMRPSLAREAT